MQKNHSNMDNMTGKHYRNPLVMAVLSFIPMYILMYAMVMGVGWHPIKKLAAMR